MSDGVSGGGFRPAPVYTKSERVKPSEVDGARPTVQARLDSHGDISIRTGARVTRARGMDVDVKRFFTEVSLPFRSAEYKTERSLRHAEYRVDRRVDRMVEDLANKGNKLSDKALLKHVEGIVREAGRAVDLAGGAGEVSGPRTMRERIRTNLDEAMLALQKVAPDKLEQVKERLGNLTDQRIEAFVKDTVGSLNGNQKVLWGLRPGQHADPPTPMMKSGVTVLQYLRDTVSDVQQEHVPKDHTLRQEGRVQAGGAERVTYERTGLALSGSEMLQWLTQNFHPTVEDSHSEECSRSVENMLRDCAKRNNMSVGDASKVLLQALAKELGKASDDEPNVADFLLKLQDITEAIGAKDRLSGRAFLDAIGTEFAGWDEANTPKCYSPEVLRRLADHLEQRVDTGVPLGRAVDEVRREIGNDDGMDPALRERLSAGLDAVAEEVRLHRELTELPTFEGLKREDVWRLFAVGRQQQEGVSKWDLEHHGQGSLAGMQRAFATMLDGHATGKRLSAEHLEAIHVEGTKNTFVTQTLVEVQRMARGGMFPEQIEEMRNEARLPPGFRTQGVDLGLRRGPEVTEDGLEELQALAKEDPWFRVKVPSDTQVMINFAPKSREECRERAEAILTTYRREIRSAEGEDQKRAVIAKAVQDLYRSHAFADGNTRTVVFTAMNRMLLDAGMSPAILHEPKAAAGYSRAEFAEEIRKGQNEFQRQAGRSPADLDAIWRTPEEVQLAKDHLARTKPDLLDVRSDWDQPGRLVGDARGGFGEPGIQAMRDYASESLTDFDNAEKHPPLQDDLPPVIEQFVTDIDRYEGWLGKRKEGEHLQREGGPDPRAALREFTGSDAAALNLSKLMNQNMLTSMMTGAMTTLEGPEGRLMPLLKGPLPENDSRAFISVQKDGDVYRLDYDIEARLGGFSTSDDGVDGFAGGRLETDGEASTVRMGMQIEIDAQDLEAGKLTAFRLVQEPRFELHVEVDKAHLLDQAYEQQRFG